METAPQDCTTQSLSEMKPATQKITEVETVAILKKCGRVKRAKVELIRVKDYSESPTVAPRISKRGKNAKITLGNSVRATRRNTKSHECESEQDKSLQLSEGNMEVVRGESFPVNSHHREAATKSTRGRKTNQALTKPLQVKEDVSKEQPTDGDKPDKPRPTCGRNTRGKRPKPDTVQSAAVEEMEQKLAPSARTKSGQIAKEDEGKVTTKSREPVKNQRRTRNVEQDPVEPSTVLNDEQATRSRRAKKAAQEKPLAESDDVQKSVAISVTDKPKQRRTKQVVGKEISAVMPEENPELKAEFKEEAEATVGKRRRVKNDVPEPIQAKRPRRGATPAPVETNAESPALGSKSEPSSKELPKRGRRAAKPSDVALLSGEELKTAVVEDANIPTRSVKWKSDIEIFENQKVKPVRGRKSKVGDRVSTLSQKEPRKTEEKDLSDKAEVQATKRARRGVGIAESIKGKHVEPETQPKTRSGRLVKK